MSARLQAWIIMIFLSLVWGSSFILMERALKGFPWYEVGMLRMTIASLIMLPLVIRFRKKLTRHDALMFFLAGLFGNLIPSVLFPLAQTVVNPTISGALNSLSPLWVITLAWLMYKKQFSGLRIIGVVVGFIGAVILVFSRSKEGIQFDENAQYSLLIVFATFCYGLSTNIIRDLVMKHSSPMVAAFQLFFIGWPMAVGLFTGTDFVDRISAQPFPWEAFGAIFLLGALGTALSVFLFARLIQLTDAVFAASVTYLMPIVALGWGIVNKDEISMFAFLGLGVILCGLYLVNRASR